MGACLQMCWVQAVAGRAVARSAVAKKRQGQEAGKQWAGRETHVAEQAAAPAFYRAAVSVRLNACIMLCTPMTACTHRNPAVLASPAFLLLRWVQGTVC